MSPKLILIVTPIATVLAWPTAGRAQVCNLNRPEATCSGNSGGLLNVCRNDRRCDGRNWAVNDYLGGPSYAGVVPELRFDYAFCEGAKSCSPYECDPETGELVLNPNCQPRIVRDRQKEAETSCTVQNHAVRAQADACQTALASSFISAGTPSLPPGERGKEYQWTNPDPHGDPCARVEASTTEDMGIGKWYADPITIPAYDPLHPPAVDPRLHWLDRLLNPELRFERTQAMRYLTGATPHTWNELFSTRRTFRQHVYTYGSLRGMGAAASYTMATPPKPLPPIEATFCGPNRASAFVQGYFNPAGGGATATPANLDVTSSGGNSTSVIRQLLADTTNVVDLLHANKLNRDCTSMAEKWRSCSSLPDGTYAHSMGAIATNVYGLTTSLNIGSVNNVGWFAPSIKNNCDIVPEITQLGLALLQQFPTTPDAAIYRCTAEHQADCIVPASQGVPARWTSMQNPVETGCTGEDCRRKWCAGRPSMPASQIWTGRGTLQDRLSTTNADKCVDLATEYARLTSECSMSLSSSAADYISCVNSIVSAIETLLNGYHDHIVGGHPTVKYNSYQVISGIDNLGRVIAKPPITGLFIQNGPPTIEPPPDGLEVRCVEIGDPGDPGGGTGDPGGGTGDPGGGSGDMPIPW